MAETVNTQNISIELTPWTDQCFSIDWLQLKEELGGNLPVGRASMIFPRNADSLKLLLEENTGELLFSDNNEGGFNFELPIFITSRGYDKNALVIDFICTPDSKFFSERISGTYSSITDAIQSVYPGSLDIRVESDQNNEQVIYQNCETSLNFLRRLGYSYKADTIFGFSWCGLLIKDIIGTSSDGKDENNIDGLPEIIGGGTGNLTNTIPYSLTYSRKQEYPIINPWTDEDNTLQETYSDYLPKNVISVLGARYYICRSGYEDMIKNYILNTTRMETNFEVNYSITGSLMPNSYRLGDLIKYRRAEDDEIKDADYYTRCLVYSNEVFIGNGQDKVGPHGFNFEWTTELRGIEKGPWTQIKEEENLSL